MKMEEIKHLISVLKIVEKYNKNSVYKLYEGAYKKLVKSFTKESAVSISFRVSFNKSFLLDRSTSILNSRKSIETYFEKYEKSSSEEDHRLDLDSFEKLTDDIAKEVKLKCPETSFEVFDVDVLFIKRAISNRDVFSGNIAFPGGRREKEDSSSCATAIRETFEEIGLNLRDNKKIYSRYIGENIDFGLTMNIKYFVSSHLFLLIDLNRQLESSFSLSKDEVSDVVMVPLGYFHLASEAIHKKVISSKTSLLGDFKVDKLILNNNPDYLVFGMTLNMISDLLNLNGTYMNFRAGFEIDGNFFKSWLAKAYVMLLQLLSRPSRVYQLLKLFLLFLSVYLIYRYYKG